jgi:ketosteroid isomerase-like protein
MTRIKKRLILALDLGLAGLLVWSAASAGIVTSGDPHDVVALQRRIAQWTEGYNAGDVSKLGDVLSADFSYEQQGAAPLPKDAVLKGYADLFARFDTRIQVDTRELRASGDMAYDRGSYLATSTPKAGGKPLVQRGRFLEVWKRSGGIWQTQRFVDITDPVE